MAAKNAGIIERHARDCPSRAGGKCPSRAKHTRWEAWVWSPEDKKKISRTFMEKSAAIKWRTTAASEVANGKMRAPTPTTVRDDAEAWLEKAERGEARARGGRPFKPSVLRTYSGDIRRYIIPALGPIKVSQLRRRDVQVRLVNDLVARGLSGSRIQGVLNALRAVLRRARKEDELLVDPVAMLDLPAAGKSRDRVADVAEADRLIAALPEEDRALWSVAFHAGLRRGELRSLRVGDLSLDGDALEIHVQRGWDDVDGEIEPKSEKGDRLVPIEPSLRLLLKEHLIRTGRRGNDLVFGRTATEPFTPTNIRNRANGAWAATVVGAFLRGESIQLVPIGLHEARHSYVSQMHAAGNSLEEIGDFVGHSSAYMTEKYRHLLPSAGPRAAAKQGRYLEQERAAIGGRTGGTSL